MEDEKQTRQQQEQKRREWTAQNPKAFHVVEFTFGTIHATWSAWSAWPTWSIWSTWWTWRTWWTWTFRMDLEDLVDLLVVLKYLVDLLVDLKDLVYRLVVDPMAHPVSEMVTTGKTDQASMVSVTLATGTTDHAIEKIPENDQRYNAEFYAFLEKSSL
ncbi:hypothetical protein COOONC_08670 [Cooperia oncophora]